MTTSPILVLFLFFFLAVFAMSLTALIFALRKDEVESHESEEETVDSVISDEANCLTLFREPHAEIALLKEIQGNKLRNQYVIVLKDQKSDCDSFQTHACGTFGLVSQHKFTESFKGFLVSDLKRQDMEMMRRDPNVASIHEDGLVASQAQTIGWQISRVGGTRSSFTIGDAKTVVNADLYVLDTGSPVHPDITVTSAVTFIPGSTNPQDFNGHSSHVCGIAAATDNKDGIVGCAPGVRLHIVQVLNAQGSGSFSSVAAGVDYVLAAKRRNPSRPIVANMSLGADVGTTSYNILDLAVSRAIAGGVIFVVAAGNSGANARNFSPAHVTTAISVGSFNLANRFSSFSNYGPSVSLLAPGENITSCWLNGRYNTISGTSMAAPAVAAIACAYVSKFPNKTPSQVKAALIALANATSTSLSRPISSVPRQTVTRSAWMGSL